MRPSLMNSPIVGQLLKSLRFVAELWQSIPAGTKVASSRTPI